MRKEVSPKATLSNRTQDLKSSLAYHENPQLNEIEQTDKKAELERHDTENRLLPNIGHQNGQSLKSFSGKSRKKRGRPRKLLINEQNLQKDQPSKQMENYNQTQKNSSRNYEMSAQRSRQKSGRSKTKYNIISYQQKRGIVQQAQKYPIADVAQMYGVSITNIQRWRKRIQRKIGAGRKLIDDEMEQQVLSWIYCNCEQSITKRQIRIKALQNTSNQQFKASKGWFQRFLARNPTIKKFLKPRKQRNSKFIKFQFDQSSQQRIQTSNIKNSNAKAIQKDYQRMLSQKHSNFKEKQPQQLVFINGLFTEFQGRKSQKYQQFEKMNPEQSQGNQCENRIKQQKGDQFNDFELKRNHQKLDQMQDMLDSQKNQENRSLNNELIDLSIGIILCQNKSSERQNVQSELSSNMEQKMPRMKTYQQIEKQNGSFLASHPTYCNDFGLFGICLQSNNCINYFNNSSSNILEESKISKDAQKSKSKPFSLLLQLKKQLSCVPKRIRPPGCVKKQTSISVQDM